MIVKQVITFLEGIIKFFEGVEDMKNRLIVVEERLDRLDPQPVSNNNPSEFHGDHRITVDEGDLIRGVFMHRRAICFNIAEEELTSLLAEKLNVTVHQIAAARAHLSGKLRNRLKRPILGAAQSNEWLQELGIEE